ncbi:hypothetical protein HPB51_024229 [Rhipicephalus microplus]|uniref:Secreted protein n=1 Tax=Rhipicephalus microplus TaxID=6941 RepID=A0A9J6DXW0_RHIMP|nr:hypothetical protein HPB51_024229 [Rhipicephalus microplus]
MNAVMLPTRWLCLLAVFLVQCRAQQHHRGVSPERSAFFGTIKQDAAVPAEQRNYAFFRYTQTHSFKHARWFVT